MHLSRYTPYVQDYIQDISKSKSFIPILRAQRYARLKNVGSLHFYALTICILPDKQRLSFSFALILRPPKQSSFVNQCACYVFNVEFNHHLWSFSCSFTTIRFSCKRNNSFDVTRMVIIWSWKFVFQMWHKEISCLYCHIQLTVFMDKTSTTIP